LHNDALFSVIDRNHTFTSKHYQKLMLFTVRMMPSGRALLNAVKDEKPTNIKGDVRLGLSEQQKATFVPDIW
jgi:hypothetical protein